MKILDVSEPEYGPTHTTLERKEWCFIQRPSQSYNMESLEICPILLRICCQIKVQD